MQTKPPQLNLEIKTETIATIQSSFDRIAKDLMENWSLRVNDKIYSFTEIEFYFFLDGLHEDNSTHEHNYNQGLWRFHSQGIDITFQSTDKSDGGILIRGINIEDQFINGPKRVLETIFRNFAPVTKTHQSFGLIPGSANHTGTIFKVARHGLSNKQDNIYKSEPYRYFTRIEDWNIKHVNGAEKERIKNASTEL